MKQKMRHLLLKDFRFWLGAIGLTIQASFLNAIYLLHWGTSVGHMTGDLAKATADLGHPVRQDQMDIFFLVALSGFVLGAMISGIYFSRGRHSFKRYDAAFAVMGVIVAIAYLSFQNYPTCSVLLAAVLCGFQNAMAKNYRGLVLRNTHVTGTLTDLGFNMGRLLAGKPTAIWRIKAQVLIIGGFAAGSAIGALAMWWVGYHALLVSSGIYMLAALVSFGWKPSESLA